MSDGVDDGIDFTEAGFLNRIPFDVWVCIMESDVLTGAELLELQDSIKADEQGFWDVYIGPMIDRVVEDFRDREVAS